MTVFELARREVTARDAARLYGLRFDRGGRGFCPWHDDGRHAALQFFDDGRCYCHACHQYGDAVAITAQMLELSPKEAAERLRADFRLDEPTTNRPDSATRAKAKKRRDEKEAFNRRWGFLCSVVAEANPELTRYDRDTAWDNPRFVAILKARSIADDRLNYMWENGYGTQ